jgi:hypothetical protein
VAFFLAKTDTAVSENDSKFYTKDRMNDHLFLEKIEIPVTNIDHFLISILEYILNLIELYMIH